MAEIRVQSPSDTPVKFELLEADSYRNYLLYDNTEIKFVLSGLLKSRDLITAYFNDGNESFLTALLDVDDSSIVLDCGASSEVNGRALAAKRLVLITTHDRVKIQFSLSGIEEIVHAGQPAFQAEIPDRLLRLQRREYYRLTASAASPLTCILSALDDGKLRTIETQMVDISCGGLAVVTAPPGIDIAPDVVFESCQVQLPDIGVIRSRLRVRNVFSITLRSGMRVKRCGCQFVDLSPAMATMVERYIMKVVRGRKARGLRAG
jgi:c-di-GMP-binding flagellar brake protein YcgR